MMHSLCPRVSGAVSAAERVARPATRAGRALNLPLAILLVLLQRTPALRVVATAAQAVLSAPLGHVLKSALATAAVLGEFNTLAGATTLESSTPDPANLTAGVSASISFGVSGTFSPPERWTVSGPQPPGMSFGSLTQSIITLSGTPNTGGSFTLTLTAINDAPAASAAFSYTINVSGADPPPVAPSITSHPQSQTVNVGSNVTLTGAASGTPTPTLQWRKNGVNITGATSSALALLNVQQSDAATYTLVATNSAGSATSNGAVLTVQAATAAPSFTTHPQGQSVTVGANVTLTAAASGNPTPTYQWRKDGVNLAGATSTSLALNNVQLADAGTYTVVATNSAGSATSNGAVLSVSAAPTTNGITFGSTTFPAMADAGQAVSFNYNVTNSGTRPWGSNHQLILRNAGGTIVASASLDGTAAGGMRTVSLGFTAPSTPGNHTYRVRARENGVGEFGPEPMHVLDVRRRVVAGDLNGDGQPDLLWQNTATGERRLWLMNGTGLGSEVDLGIVGLDWEIAGTGDFNNDGQHDIVWQNRTTGERTVWLMNGTALAGAVSIGTIDPVWNIGLAADFNVDGHADLLWENTLTGERGIWLMTGVNLTGYAALGTLGIQWTAAGTGDFNGDQARDIVWQNSLTGERRVWLMNGATKSSEASLGFVALEWVIGAVADYNGDGQADVYWQNTTTGERAIWLMSGTTVAGFAFLPTEVTSWVVGRIPRRPATPDFNLDGKPDLVWQNTSTGERKVWLMNGTTMTAEASWGAVATAWQIAGAADIDNDGRTDVLWQNTVTGERGLWLMSGTSILGWASLGTVGLDWQIVGTADFNADNRTDIVWRNSATGEVGVWLMFGTSVSGFVSITTQSTAWRVACAADLNRDDKPDLVWENTSTGERKVWLMNGTTFGSEVSLGTVGLDWQIAGAADFNLNGSVDILWQNTATGERGVWLMDSTTLAGFVALPTQPTAWLIGN